MLHRRSVESIHRLRYSHSPTKPSSQALEPATYLSEEGFAQRPRRHSRSHDRHNHSGSSGSGGGGGGGGDGDDGDGDEAKMSALR